MNDQPNRQFYVQTALDRINRQAKELSEMANSLEGRLGCCLSDAVPTPGQDCSKLAESNVPLSKELNDHGDILESVISHLSSIINRIELPAVSHGRSSEGLPIPTGRFQGAPLR